MSENQFMAINRLPSKTWYWLKLNETHIRWQDETRPCVTLAENVRAGQADEAKFAAIRTGAGEQLESAMAGLPVTTIAGAQSETIRLRVAAGEGARQSGGVVHVQADEGQSVTVVEQIVPTGDGATALQPKPYATKNAKICQVQLLSASTSRWTARASIWSATGRSLKVRWAIWRRKTRRWIST